MWERLVESIAFAVLLATIPARLAAEPIAIPALTPPIVADVHWLGGSGAAMVVLHDSTGRRICFSYEWWQSRTMPQRRIIPAQHILLGGDDPTVLPDHPLPVWGEAEANLLALAVPPVMALRDSLQAIRASLPNKSVDGDTVEVRAASPVHMDLVGSTLVAIQQRVKTIEAARRGNTGIEEDARNYFALRAPLRARDLRWSRQHQEWTLVIGDSITSEIRVLIPKRAGQVSASCFDATCTTRFENIEGSVEDQRLLVVAQEALRDSPVPGATPTQVAELIRAIRERMARILVALRGD